jgi:hypothetical protein
MKSMRPNYYLVGTSTLFLLPALYGYSKGIPILPTVTVFTTLVSINYWKNPVEGFRKNMDLIFSKFSATTYVIYGNLYMKPTNLFYGYINLFFIFYLYHMSCLFHRKSDPLWVVYHIAFHYFVMNGKFMILG